MSLVHWEPARELSSLQSEMNRLFNTFFDTPGDAGGAGSAGNRWIPAMDLVEEDEHFVLSADLPGIDPDDVTVEVDNGVLSISGERRQESSSKSKGFYRLERATGGFRRTVTLPADIDAGAIEARFDKGVLELRIPKPEQPEPHRVRITAAREPEAIEA